MRDKESNLSIFDIVESIKTPVGTILHSKQDLKKYCVNNDLCTSQYERDVTDKLFEWIYNKHKD